jgi:hypothetical protein
MNGNSHLLSIPSSFRGVRQFICVFSSERSLVFAQVGIAGNTKVDAYTTLAGQVGIAGQFEDRQQGDRGGAIRGDALNIGRREMAWFTGATRSTGEAANNRVAAASGVDPVGERIGKAVGEAARRAARSMK